jgi:hypothetical protein
MSTCGFDVGMPDAMSIQLLVEFTITLDQKIARPAGDPEEFAIGAGTFGGLNQVGVLLRKIALRCCGAERADPCEFVRVQHATPNRMAATHR